MGSYFWAKAVHKWPGSWCHRTRTEDAWSFELMEEYLVVACSIVVVIIII